MSSSWPYQVADCEADLYRYLEEYFMFWKNDYLVTTEYHSSRSFSVIVARLDSPHGWNVHLQTMVYFPLIEKSIVVDIGMECDGARPLTWIKRVRVDTDFDIFPSTSLVPDFNKLQYHSLDQSPLHIEHVDLTTFNELFSSAHIDAETFPPTLYVYGICQRTCSRAEGAEKDDSPRIVCSNAKYPDYLSNFGNNGTYHPAQLLLHVALNDKLFDDGFYFVMSELDGGLLEGCRWSATRYQKVGGDKHDGRGYYGATLSETEFPIVHAKKHVLGMSNHVGHPLLLNVPDRHYFYHNLYHSFRSYHRGIPFLSKRNQIVYGANVRNSHANNFREFTRRDCTQREHFFQVCAPLLEQKGILHYGTNIARYNQVEYKYILDIDGHGSTWDATAWKLNSGSVLFKTESNYRQWFYGQMERGVHYLEVRDDFSNLEELYHWCETHPDECEWISRNARELFQRVYSYRSVIEYMRHLAETLAS